VRSRRKMKRIDKQQEDQERRRRRRSERDAKVKNEKVSRKV